MIIVIMIMTTILVIATIATGLYFLNKEDQNTGFKISKALRINLFVFIPLLLGALTILMPDAVKAATRAPQQTSASGLQYIAAALSTGLATIGAGYAVGAVGSSALGAVSEDPKILGKTLIFVGLAEGVAIYGLIVSIFILFV